MRTTLQRGEISVVMKVRHTGQVREAQRDRDCTRCGPASIKRGELYADLSATWPARQQLLCCTCLGKLAIELTGSAVVQTHTQALPERTPAQVRRA